MSSEHVEVLERLRGVLEHGKMGDKCLIAPDLVTAAIAALSAPQPPAEAQLTYKGVPIGPMQTFADVERQASVPVGVEGLSASLRDARERMIAALGSRFGEAFDGDFDVMRDAADALAQQPAAVFRNDGNSEADFIADDAIACTACGGSGHRDDQQPAAVDSEMVTRAVNAYDEATGEGWQMPCLQGMRAALTAALAGQQGDSHD